MFARLKRRRDEDEESLVPHGFLWQATDAPGHAEEDQVGLVKPAAFEDNQATSEVVEMPAKATPQPQADPPGKLGAISPPLQWPSPHIQEIARHPETCITQPTPVVVIEQQGTKEPAGVDTPAATLAAGPAPPARPNLTVVVRALQAFAAFRMEVHRRFERANVKGRVVNAGSLAGAELRDQRQRLRPLGIDAAQKLSTWQQAVMRRSRLGIHKSVETLKSIDFSLPVRTLRRARNLKVTVRIPHQDTARIAAAISTMRAPWNRARNTANRDSRLWTSMAMAGLSALLALGFISTVRRYEPDSSPGVVAAHSTDTAGPIKPAALAPIPPVVQKVIASSVAQRPSPAVRKQTDAAPRQTKLATLKSSAPAVKPAVSAKPKRKVHFSEDDDYVAKDTYVVYGRNGKQSR